MKDFRETKLKKGIDKGMRKQTKTDYRVKHIVISDEGKDYLIGFHYGLFRGIRVIHMSGFSENAKVISAYPPLLGVIGEVLMRSGSECLQSLGIHIAGCFGYRCN